MNGRLAAEFRVVRFASFFCALVTLLCLGIWFFGAALLVYAKLNGCLDVLSPLQVTYMCADHVVGCVLMASLSLFFLRLARGVNPLGRRQVRRVTVACLMLVLRILLVSVQRPFPDIQITDGPPPIGISYDGGLDLKIVTFIALIFCTATIMRYGNVLEDALSDIA